MTTLHDLYAEQGQSPWLDNLRRDWIQDGTLAGLVDQGIRGITSNPTIFAKAISGQDTYDEQFRSLIATTSVEDAYWDLVVDDILAALAILRPTYDASDGSDGFVSVEVAPSLAHDTAGTTEAARGLHTRIDRPNVLVKIPATPECVPSIRQMITEGRSINVTLIFSLTRYAEVMEAYLSGLEALAASGTDDLSGVASVASFFISRVDTEVDKRIEAAAKDAPGLLELRGKAAVAQARLAGATPTVGLHVDQEPGLPGPRLRRHPHRPRHRQHHARRDRGRLPRPRHRGPHGRPRCRRGPVGHRPAGGGRHRHGGRGGRTRDRGRGVVRRLVRRSDGLPHHQGR
jgi:transaldolase